MRGFTGRRLRLSTRSAATVATGVLLLSALLAPATLAATPNDGTATVDGATGDWSLGADFFADMTPGGSGHNLLAKLYLRYDCDAGVLYALVLAQDPERILQTDPTPSPGSDFTESYLQIDGSGKAVHGGSGNNGTPPDFAFVNPEGDVADGFEASASLGSGSHTLRAHVLIADSDAEDGYVAVDTAGRTVPLDIECQEVQPTATAKPPTPKPTDNGGVAPTTGTHQGPTKTLPPTDTLDSTGTSSSGIGLILTILAVGSLATVIVTLGGRRRSLARVEVKENDER
jgi:hypothetical protein